MDLAEFLLARIAEDEAAVAAILRQHPHWEADGDDVLDQPEYVIAHVRGDYAARHIARHDPARVLAECEAKRRIVDCHRLIGGVDAWDMPVIGCGNCCACGTEGEYLIPGSCLTVRLLALPYADHPDYRSEWAP